MLLRISKGLQGLGSFSHLSDHNALLCTSGASRPCLGSFVLQPLSLLWGQFWLAGEREEQGGTAGRTAAVFCVHSFNALCNVWAAFLSRCNIKWLWINNLVQIPGYLWMKLDNRKRRKGRNNKEPKREVQVLQGHHLLKQFLFFSPKCSNLCCLQVDLGSQGFNFLREKKSHDQILLLLMNMEDHSEAKQRQQWHLISNKQYAHNLDTREICFWYSMTL